MLLYSGGLMLSATLVCAVAGFLFESRVTARDAKRFSMPGQLVDVGGYRLQLNCTGAGSPTVVLEAGFANSSLEWNRVQPAVAQFTRVCSYDRAGLGWSDPTNAPRTTQQMARELRALLKSAGIEGPFVVVGHSYGGLIARQFASEHPEEVSGLILVDSVNPDHTAWDRPGSLREEFLMWLFRTTAPFGVPRVLGHCPMGPESCVQFAKTYQAMRAGRIESARMVRSRGDLGHLPLTVMAHDPAYYLQADRTTGEYRRQEDWMNGQRELAHLTNRGKILIVNQSGHSIPQQMPASVIGAIGEMVSSMRGQYPQRRILDDPDPQLRFANNSRPKE